MTEPNKRIAIYPGTFDPFHNGHLSIVRRASKLFDEVIILMADNSSKQRTWCAAEMEAAIRDSLNDALGDGLELFNVFVDASRGLSTAAYAMQHGACAIVRGIRTATDLEYESIVQHGNQMLYAGGRLEHVYLLADGDQPWLSSSFIREMVRSGISKHRLAAMVPRPVYDMICAHPEMCMNN